MSAALVATIAAAGGANGATTTGVDTTGANLIVLGVTSLTAVSDATISDSKSNTWTAGTRQTTANAYLTLYYCIGPTVGASHTFTASVTSGHSTIGGFSFSAANGGIDKQATNFDNSGSATFLAPGSVLPAVNGEVLVTGLCFAQPDSNPTIDSSFVSPGPVYLNQAANNQGLCMSYLIQGTAGTVNCFWSFGAVFYLAANIATFKPGGGGGATNIFGRSTLDGLSSVGPKQFTRTS